MFCIAEESGLICSSRHPQGPALHFTLQPVTKQETESLGKEQQIGYAQEW